MFSVFIYFEKFTKGNSKVMKKTTPNVKKLKNKLSGHVALQ